MTEFGERLREARLRRGLNQVELANMMGLTQASISQFEKGQRLPAPRNISKFASVLGVRREYLAGDRQGNFEVSLLQRTIKGLSPASIKKIVEYAQSLKQKEKTKRLGGN